MRPINRIKVYNLSTILCLTFLKNGNNFRLHLIENTSFNVPFYFLAFNLSKNLTLCINRLKLHPTIKTNYLQYCIGLIVLK